MESIWTKREQEYAKGKEPKGLRHPLPGSAEAVVIGGGMAGILCAWQLKEAGVRAIVLEASTVGSGQTKNTTAKITSQHALIYDKLIKSMGETAAQQYADANQKAIVEYERIIKQKKISCGFKRVPAYLYTKEPLGTVKLERELAAARRLGISASLKGAHTEKTELPFPIKASLKFSRQAQFRPLEFLYALASELPVYEHTRVIRVRGHEVITNRGRITTKHIIFATHYPFPNWPGLFFMRMHQERSYVLAIRTSNADTDNKALTGMYYGIDTGGLSLRSTEDMILIGGQGHRTGESCGREPFEDLRREAEKMYPGCQIEAAWAAQDCMTLDSVPYIGHFSKGKPYWYAATGFGKWGMTTSMVSAMIIRDMIIGKENPNRHVFSPQRITIRASMKNFMKDSAYSVRNLLALGGPRCPHLGCKLRWNWAEQSWDCPCHGSRFTKEGKLIDNPAQTGLKWRS